MTIRIALKKAERLHDQCRYAEAIDELDQAIQEEGPEQFEVFTARGFARSALGDRAGALGDYDQAVALKPDEPALYYSRGREHINAQHYREGIDDMTLAIQTDEALGSEYYASSARFVRAVAYFLMGDCQRAADACDGLPASAQTYIARRVWKLRDIIG